MPTRQPKILACVALALVGGGAAGCDGDEEALKEARQGFAEAPRVVVARGSRIETYAPGLGVIEEKGRVIMWAKPHVERSWRPERRCYDRRVPPEPLC